MTGRSVGDVTSELSRAQKPSAGTPAYSRFVNRRLGRYLAAVAFLAGRTPNQFSLSSGFCSLVGIVLIATIEPSPTLALVVTALLVLGYALDSADGQLARLRGGGSPLGEWMDHVIDCVKIVLLHSAVLISLYRFGAFSNELVLLVPLTYLCVSAVMFFRLILIDQLRRRHGGVTTNVRADSVLKSLLIAPTDYGVLCLVFLTLGWPMLFVMLYGALVAANLVFLLAAIASQHCDYLIAGVVEDDVVTRIKGRPPVVPHDERMEVVRAIALVDEVVSDWSSDRFEMWKQLRYDVLFKGDDWKGREKGTRLERMLGEVGAYVHYFPYTASTSSTDLRRLLEGTA